MRIEYTRKFPEIAFFLKEKSEAPAKTDYNRDAMALTIRAVNIMLYSTENLPTWFKIGCFEPLRRGTHSATKVYYAKYLYVLVAARFLFKKGGENCFKAGALLIVFLLIQTAFLLSLL